MKKGLILALIIFVSVFVNAGGKKVLVEVFTNSHCGICPNAHNAINNYLVINSDKINYIYYHMAFPYPDDQLNLVNTSDPAGRNNYYGPFIFTPVVFFNGTQQQNIYSSWENTLNAMAAEQSNFDITLSGTKNGGEIEVASQVTSTGAAADSNLVIHFIIVEDVIYAGRNGITDHKHTMRKMITSPTGESFSILPGGTETVTKQISLDPLWNPEKLKVIVFVQNSGSKEVYQSALIDYANLNITGIGENEKIPGKFNLSQNYPNPFNPSTTISYDVPVASHISLKVYDVLGNEIAELVDDFKQAGSYKVGFSINNFSIKSSGVFFYSLKAGTTKSVKKMIYLK